MPRAHAGCTPPASCDGPVCRHEKALRADELGGLFSIVPSRVRVRRYFMSDRIASLYAVGSAMSRPSARSAWS